MRSITDPFGDEIEYASDKAGRLTDVTGSSFAKLAVSAIQVDDERAHGQDEANPATESMKRNIEGLILILSLEIEPTTGQDGVREYLNQNHPEVSA